MFDAIFWQWRRSAILSPLRASPGWRDLRAVPVADAVFGHHDRRAPRLPLRLTHVARRFRLARGSFRPQVADLYSRYRCGHRPDPRQRVIDRLRAHVDACVVLASARVAVEVVRRPTDEQHYRVMRLTEAAAGTRAAPWPDSKSPIAGASCAGPSRARLQGSSRASDARVCGSTTRESRHARRRSGCGCPAGRVRPRPAASAARRVPVASRPGCKNPPGRRRAVMTMSGTNSGFLQPIT